MAEKKLDIILEREYIIPLRKEISKVPRYRKAEKAITGIRKFLARHMKVADRNLKLVKIDRFLNEEVWFRGIRKPPIKIKVKALKYSNGTVIAQLAEIPEKKKWIYEREKKLSKEKEEKEKEEEKKKAEEEIEEKREKEKEEEKKKAEEEIEEKREKIIQKQQRYGVGGEKKKPQIKRTVR